jgi:hypothetical protein
VVVRGSPYRPTAEILGSDIPSWAGFTTPMTSQIQSEADQCAGKLPLYRGISVCGRIDALFGSARRNGWCAQARIDDLTSPPSRYIYDILSILPSSIPAATTVFSFSSICSFQQNPTFPKTDIQHFDILTSMFVQSDNTESRSVENEIVRRLAIRVVDAFTNDVKPASTQEISCECRNRRVDEYASESGLVTLAGIEMILEEALYPILDRLVMIERKLCHSDVDSSRQQDVPITVTPSSTPAFVYDNDDRLQLSPDGKYTFSGSLFDTSDFASFEDDGNEYGSSADSVSDSSREKLKETGGSRRDTFYR